MKRTLAGLICWAWLLLVIAAVVPAWCAEKRIENVRGAVSLKSLGFLDVWAARERGFYRKHGLDEEIITMLPQLTVRTFHAVQPDYAFGASSISRGSMLGPVEEVLRERR